MIGRPSTRRAPFSLAAAAVIGGCYGAAGLVAAVVPGLHGAGRAVLVGMLLAAMAGIVGWLGAPRLAAPPPPQLPEPPRRATFPETERLARRLAFDRQLDGSLAGARHDDERFAVVGQALQHLAPGDTAELLLSAADGDELHRRAASAVATSPDGLGCAVGYQSDCPAIASGLTRRFATSDAPDACRHLHERGPQPLSAVCVPVRLDGRRIGVLHRVGLVAEPVSELEVSCLESLAAKLESHHAEQHGPHHGTEPERVAPLG